MFAHLAEGLSLIAERVRSLDEAAAALKGRSSALLAMVASEEAGKFLVLLDAVRVPRNRQAVRRDQLKRASDHLAKHLYARAAEIRSTSFKDLLSHLEYYRQAYYLDGTNDYDWIFRNDIDQEREGLLYVDLLEVDGRLQWWAPTGRDLWGSGWGPSSGGRLVDTLAKSEATTPDGLAVMATCWRDFELGPETPYSVLADRIRGFLAALHDKGLSASLTPMEKRLLVDSWPFPLYDADLRLIERTVDDMRQERERRHDAFVEREYGPFD
ncbi:MAG: hypothetical protein LC808_28205 [Actinobacteria bacterium]|nr:hypothetical protein [Actinomycetota bacterium]